jgi:1,4-dihydroxy-2-naphthoate octaprenyltransferase
MSNLRLWFLATRPKTLVASGIPVVMGASLAYYDGSFSLVSASVSLVCSLLIQIATNFINEIYDFRKGADTVSRVGPMRAVSAGLISEGAMIRAAWIVVGICFVMGMYLVWLRGIYVLIIGIVSLGLAWGYTGGRYSLAYRGLGDVFVFIFFGLVATGGTYFVLSGGITVSALLVGCVPGAFAANILGVNNLRDRETDILVGKRTFAVRFGAFAARGLYIIMMMIAYSVPILLLNMGYYRLVLLPMLTLPLSWILCRKVLTLEGERLNGVLAQTGLLLALFGLLLSVGFVLGSK